MPIAAGMQARPPVLSMLCRKCLCNMEGKEYSPNFRAEEALPSKSFAAQVRILMFAQHDSEALGNVQDF